ncbi:hypothetical protein FRC03_005400 [Tulasnella sp. 419]|nr:hypothetical protein FRC03_005400 [Tulasnella sp. 419]
MPNEQTSTCAGFVPSGPDEGRPLVFSSVETVTADVDLPSLHSSYTDIGTIVIEVTKVKVNGFKARHPFPDHRDKVLVHESTKLEGAHATILDSTKTLEHKSVACNTEPLCEPDNDPFLKFVFRYRSRDILMANRIIPSDRSASQNDDGDPKPRESVKEGSDDGQEDDYDVELLELEVQEAEAEAQKAAAEAQKASAHAALLATKANKAALLQSKAQGR